MNAKTEDSMMLALSELRNIEADRLTEEASARAAQAKREEELRKQEQQDRQRQLQLRLAEEAQLQRVAEAEARLRVVERQRAQDLAQRAEQLEQELRVTRVERALVSARLGSIEDDVSQTSQRWRWRLVGAVSSCLLLGAVAVIGIGPSLRRVPAPAVVSVPARPAQSAQELQLRVESEVQRRVQSMEQQLVALRQATESLPPPSRPSVRRSSGDSKPATATANLSQAAADCQDDPLCGIAGKK
jgi:hypothetical protein